MEEMDNLTIAGRQFCSRLFLGTGKFSSNEIMSEAIKASGTQMVTMAMRRIDVDNASQDDMLSHINLPGVHLLPNTSGARNATEAVFAAKMAREVFGTSWLKLEIHPDPRYLLPDPIETLIATEKLVKEGFTVLPYCQADPVICKRLVEVGAAVVMPLAAPIGSNMGLVTTEMLSIIIEESTVPVIIDAGLGAPSHATAAIEMGADAVLINTAISIAKDPVTMAAAFRKAVEAGREAYLAGLATKSVTFEAQNSSPLTKFLD